MSHAEVYDERKHPFYIVYNDVIERYGPKIGAYGLAVYSVLAYYANDKHDAWPSYQTIADQLGMSRRKVVTTIDLLIEIGLVAKEQRRSASGDPTSNVYRLLPTQGKPSACGAPPSAQDALPPSAQDALPSAPRAHDQDPMNNTQLGTRPREEGEGASAPPPPAEPPKVVRSRQPTNSKLRITSPHLRDAQFVEGFIPAGAATNAVQVYYERFCINEKAAILKPMQEDDLVRLCPNLDRLREVVTAYSQTHYKPGNVRLILDWYRDGPPSHRRNSDRPKQSAGSDAVDRVFARLEQEGVLHE